MPIGMLTQKTELHEKWRSSRPPTNGPATMPTPEKAAQMPIALPRSRGSRNTLVRIDSVDGMIIAPPMPMKARVRIRPSAVLCIAEAAEPMPNRTMPIVSRRLRPKRSPRLPVVSSRPANTIV